MNVRIRHREISIPQGSPWNNGELTCSKEASPRTKRYKDLKSRSGSPRRPLIAVSFRSVHRSFFSSGVHRWLDSATVLVISEKRSQFSTESWPQHQFPFFCRHPCRYQKRCCILLSNWTPGLLGNVLATLRVFLVPTKRGMWHPERGSYEIEQRDFFTPGKINLL